MKIQYCSDLHLEFKENKEFLTLNPLPANGEILLLAGDIVPFAVMRKHNYFFDYISDHFKFTYWVPGNHEYYDSDISKKSGTIYESIRENVFLINNQEVKIEETKLIFTTLWTEISVDKQLVIKQNMSDFHRINNNGEWFTTEHYNALHTQSVNFLKDALSKNNSMNTIVVSHHTPTFYNYPDKYKGDPINEAFAVELFDLIENSKINYWIFGHHHQNIQSFTIGNTKLLNNQLGYVKYHENPDFKGDSIISI